VRRTIGRLAQLLVLTLGALALGRAGLALGTAWAAERHVFLPLPAAVKRAARAQQGIDSARVARLLQAARGTNTVACELAAATVDGRSGWSSGTDGDFTAGSSADSTARDVATWLHHGDVHAGAVPLLVTMVLALPFYGLAGRQSQAITAAVSEPARALGLAEALFVRLAAERPTAARLAAIARSLATSASPPVPAIRALRRLVDLLDAQRNPIFAPIALATLWPIQIAFAIEAWRRRHGVAVASWLDLLGEIEALVALGTYTIEHPADALPVFADGAPRFEAEALGHPLIPAARCIRNDVALDATAPVLVVSGSNMSGKSTLLRSVGVNAVLALAGAPVRAARLRLTPLAIGASIRTLDSLSEGTSRFYAEITRIRQVVDLAEGEQPLLFLLDEILHGTNTRERLIGARAIVRELVAMGALGAVSTHDLGIGDLETELDGQVKNVHFEEQVDGERMTFDYRLRGGIVQSSNALRLMKIVGIDIV